MSRGKKDKNIEKKNKIAKVKKTKEEKRERRKQYFFVIRELTSREIKRKYSRSYLGVLWSILNPLLMMSVLSMIFTQIFDRAIENYPIYYLSGYTMWHMFTGATNAAMTTLVDNKSMLIKVRLPMEIFVLARVYTALVNLGYSMIAYLVMLIVFGIVPKITMLYFPLVVLFMLLFSTGMSFILATAYVFFGDVKYLYSVVTTLWMYCSAIFYPVDRLEGPIRAIIEINPIYEFICAVRNVVMYGVWPSLVQTAIMATWSIVMLGVGYLIFSKNKNMVMQKI